MMNRIKKWFGKYSMTSDVLDDLVSSNQNSPFSKGYKPNLNDHFTIRELVSHFLREDWGKLQEVEEEKSPYWNLTLTIKIENLELSEMKEIAKQVKAEICAKEP